ncbi:MAG TPA: tetratricopeptide repeat protein [Gemmatimonadaceae bacterium]|nr:tetratricopeptide repeat protein [Gemmatimonadaceae bacterium]
MKHRLSTATCAIFAVFLAANPLRGQSVEQGVQLFNARKYAEAQAALLPQGQTDATAAYYLGRIEMEYGDSDKAADWFERAVALNPKSAVYYDWLARAYGTQAEHTSKFRLPFLARKLKNALDTGLGLDPDNLDIRDDLIVYYTRAPGFLGGSKEKALETVVEIKKRNAYRGSLAAANLCAAIKDIACAESQLQGMATTYPDSASVYAALAAFYTNQKQADKAFAVLDERLRAKPNEPITLYQVGRTASLSGENLDHGEQALKAYLAGPIPERGPEPAHAHYRLGTIYEKKGAKDLAREEYRTALQLNPRHQEARKALANLR